MKLQSRRGEIELLRRQRWLSEEQGSKVTLVLGKRLSGKTAIIAEAYSDRPFLYLELTGKTEILQMEGYSRQAREKLGIDVPYTINTVRKLIEYLFRISSRNPMTIVVEDFDEMLRRDPGFYEAMKTLWKRERRTSNVNLVLTMTNPHHAEKIFYAQGAPLFNMVDTEITLDYMTVAELKQAMDSSGKPWTNEDLLAMYMVTGGCPKFVRYALSKGAVCRTDIIKTFVSSDSPYILEIGCMLMEILGHNSEVYLSLLQLIANGTRMLGELEERLGGIIVGGHLAKLENEYGLLVKTRPVLADSRSRNVVRYEIADHMFEFWLRYIETARYMLETGDLDELRGTIDRDFWTHGRNVLRHFLRKRFAEENGLTEIGGDWKSGKDSVFELDIVGVDKASKTALVADVEIDASTFRKDPFLDRVKTLKDGPLRGYTVDARLFTLADM